MVISVIFICYVIFALILLKNGVTFRHHERIIDAIYAYSMQLIEEGRWEDIQVEFNDMEPYDRTMLRLWDWGPTRILPPEKYEIIKPYIMEE